MRLRGFLVPLSRTKKEIKNVDAISEYEQHQKRRQMDCRLMERVAKGKLVRWDFAGDLACEAKTE